jgi:hypothetical protein
MEKGLALVEHACQRDVTVGVHAEREQVDQRASPAEHSRMAAGTQAEASRW